MATRSRRQLLDWVARQKYLTHSDAQTAALDAAYPQWRQRLDDKWLASFTSLVEFFKATRRFPASSAEDPEEKRLGIWLGTQKKNVDTLREDRRDLLDENLPGWAEKLHKTWDLRLEEVCAMVADLGRIPRRDDAGPAARSALIWLYNNRRLSDTDPRVLTLNARIPGWNIGHKDIWRQKFTDACAFYDARGILPNKKSEDPAERSLGVWLDNCRRKMESLSSERLQLLDTGLPGWRRTRDSVWSNNVNMVCEFVAAHGRFPEPKATDPEEAVLGVWLQNQRSSVGSMEESRRNIWDERIPGWRQNTREDTWAAMLEQCVEFARIHGRLPMVSGRKPSERGAAIWLGNQRAVKNKMPAGRRESLTSRLPGWDITREQIWQAKLQMCFDFVRVHGRMPSSGKRAPEDEQELGRWLIIQRKTAAKLQRDGVLDAKLPGWR